MCNFKYFQKDLQELSYYIVTKLCNFLYNMFERENYECEV